MWDALDIDTDAPEWPELIEATDRSNVDQALLDRVSVRARASMAGAELVLMSYARNEAEQTGLLADLAARVVEGERVVLDITHGFRHLPMLALVAARYLGHVRGAEVAGIYYGALEMTTPEGITPVLKLDGLLRMLDWTEAFAAPNASGNYAAFAPLLVHDGLPPASAGQLQRAAHLERVTNAGEARAIITPMLDEIGKLGGATRLFAGQLAQRLAWARQPSRQAREMALHQAYLARNDFLRATLYLQESAISAECYRLKLDSNAHLQREEAPASLKANTAFNSLSDIRNMLAHGTGGADTTRAAAAKSATTTAAGLASRLRQLGKDLPR